MRDNKKITALILILIFIFSATAVVGAQGRINDMNFKNADLTDVLRAIAEVANVNLITDSSVSGTVTVHLKDISFIKALDLITQTRALTYEWDENTVVVAPPDRIDDIYANIITEFVPINSNDISGISVIVKDIFPETQITVDSVRSQFILKGEQSRVIEIKEMINRLDSSAVVQERKEEKEEKAQKEAELAKIKEKEEIYTDSYQLLNAEMTDLIDKLKSVNSELSIRSNALTKKIIISGNKEEVETAIAMASTYDQSLEPETRKIRVDYIDTEQITEIVGKFYPNIKLHVNAKRKEIIINGAKNKLDNVVDLIREINIPQNQVMIEIRVEEISSDLSREIGIDNLDNFSTIEFEKDADGDINGISYTWPQLFKLLDKSNDSVTLANPRLMTMNGEEATMSILDKEPYPVKVINEDGTSSITYNYAEAGVQMTFTPWITENNEVELSISPEVSNFTRINPDSTAPPATSNRSVNTKLRLKDGEMFAIGGLIQTEKNGTVTKIPLLGDLPLIGELFKSKLSESDRTELVVFVRPKIIKYNQRVDKTEHLVTINLDNDEENIDQESETELENETVTEETNNTANLDDEILEEAENETNNENEFQELTPEELEEILNNN